MSCNCCPPPDFELDCNQGVEFTSYRFKFKVLNGETGDFWSIPLNLGGHLRGTYICEAGKTSEIVSPNVLNFTCPGCTNCANFDPTTCPCNEYPRTNVIGATEQLADTNGICYGFYNVAYDAAPCVIVPAFSWYPKPTPGVVSAVVRYTITLTSNCGGLGQAPIYECNLGEGYPGPWYQVVLSITGAAATKGNGATCNCTYRVNIPRFTYVQNSLTLYRSGPPGYSKCCPPVAVGPCNGSNCPNSPSMDKVLTDYQNFPETITITRAG